MLFERIEPSLATRNIVECYWYVIDDDTKPVKQKIIPDGFTEIIFHFGDSYRINLDKRWTKQGKSLLAGQIRKHFYLENSGSTEILGIKLKPAALTQLFGLDMKSFTDTVVTLNAATGKTFRLLETEIRSLKENHERITCIERFFNEQTPLYPVNHPVDRALERIFEKRGMITIANICSELSVSERYVEQLFQKYVGVSPKFFARIVRFSHIFQLIKEQSPNWSDVVYEAGYYDQSHFIRNFKAFTGEDPTSYMFAEKNLANFFMKENRLVRVCTIVCEQLTLGLFKKIMRFILLIICMCALISTQAQTTKTAPRTTADLKKVGWLTGQWTRTNVKAGRSGYETWKKASSTEFIGRGVAMKGVDTALVEKIRIVLKDDKIFYVADVPENKSEVFFEFTELTDNNFVCENPNHDFPKKISYRLEGEVMKATISGDGKAIDYLFVRAKE